MKPRHFLTLVLIFFIGMFINQCVREEPSSSQDFIDTLGLRNSGAGGTSNGFHWNFPGSEQTVRTLPDVVVPAAGVTTLSVSNTNGSVTITGVDGQTDIVVRQTASLTHAGRRADDDIAAYRLDQKTEAGTLTLKPVVPAGSLLTVSFDITAPKAMNVSVGTANGRLTIADTEGAIAAHSTNGSLSASGITVPEAEFVTTNGSITLTKLASDAAEGTHRLRVASTNGSITLVDASLKQFTADFSSSNGHVDVSASSFAALAVKTQNGTVALSSVTAPMTVQTTTGGVTAGGCRGQMDIASTDGSVRVTGLADATIVDTTDGKIFVDVACATPPLRLETTNGSIDLTLGQTDDFTVRATARDKSVGNDTGLAATSAGGVTTIGAGPTIVTLKTNNGRIQITRGGTQ